MTEEQWIVCAKVLASFYPHNFKMTDELVMNLWFEMLEDLPGERVIAAIKHMVKTQPAFPSVADVRRHAEVRRDPLEAWREVLKASADSGAPEHQRYIPAPRQVETSGGYVRGGEKSYTLHSPQWSSVAVEKALEAVGGLLAIKTARPAQMDALRGQFVKAFQAFSGSELRRETFDQLGVSEQPVLMSRPDVRQLAAGIGREVRDDD